MSDSPEPDAIVNVDEVEEDAPDELDTRIRWSDTHLVALAIKTSAPIWALFLKLCRCSADVPV